MAKAKRKRWVCPTGDHPGVLGPGKPAANNIVRFCLPCSAKTGFLVERTCPANEKKREKAGEAAKEKAKKKRDAKRKKEVDQFFAGGVDIRRRFKALKKLKAWKAGRFYTVRNAEITVRRRRDGGHVSGHAKTYRGNIVVTIPVSATRGQVEMLLLHELAHLAARLGSKHGPVWKRLYAEACCEAWGVGSCVSGGWKLDDDIAKQIDKKLKARKQRGKEEQGQEEGPEAEAPEQEGDKDRKAASRGIPARLRVYP
jgi:hypothetical protein